MLIVWQTLFDMALREGTAETYDNDITGERLRPFFPAPSPAGTSSSIGGFLLPLAAWRLVHT